jgi:hypothetical protein
VDEGIDQLFRQPAEQSFLKDLRKLAGAIVDDPPDAASFLAHVMVGDKGLRKGQSRLIRLNPLISPVPVNQEWSPPAGWSTDDFVEFMKLDMDAHVQTEIDRIKASAIAWLADKTLNQPVRLAGDTPGSEIGQRLIRGALAEWNNIKNAPPPAARR